MFTLSDRDDREIENYLNIKKYFLTKDIYSNIMCYKVKLNVMS